MGILGVIAGAIGAWVVLAVAVALGIGRAISLADRRTHRLRLLRSEQVEQVAVHRTVSLNTAQMPKISVTRSAS